ncbi:MAG: dTDP-4-dehydrorhamnose 3,5-epimerase [Roseiflexaceae bacterium]|nr:dTDP-4-dehydrorhamnose 3,5-epimerase [Roseiflexaceae bacterium]
MLFHETELNGAYILEPQRIADQRGFFARAWCATEFSERGLNTQLAQCNISYNANKGTLRGMHYQAAPHAETKLIRCTIGAIYDVIIDLRPESPTYTKHIGVTLSAESRLLLYIPEGFAHGFLTLTDESEVFYQMSEFYMPAAARGVRWNDPAFGIVWPAAVEIIATRDASYPDFDEASQQ